MLCIFIYLGSDKIKLSLESHLSHMIQIIIGFLKGKKEETRAPVFQTKGYHYNRGTTPEVNVKVND